MNLHHCTHEKTQSKTVHVTTAEVQYFLSYLDFLPFFLCFGNADMRK